MKKNKASGPEPKRLAFRLEGWCLSDLYFQNSDTGIVYDISADWSATCILDQLSHTFSIAS